MSDKKKVYIETYGCQMNVYDSELIAGIMKDLDYELVDNPEEADVIFMNTCSVRENAEQRVWGQLSRFKHLKEKKPEMILGVVGCMAKNLEEEIHRKRPYVNLILGPDSYRKLPQIIRRPAVQGSAEVDSAEQRFAIDTELSRTELYDDLTPVRFSATSAWIAIMRGCDNFCSYCVVPYTRGRERSRPLESIVREAQQAVAKGIKEIGLLGQNVNSYRDGNRTFTDLMRAVSDIPGVRRIRFTSPHPKDLSTELLTLMAERSNLCKHIHLPVQSGSDRILQLMRRSYTRVEYLALVDRIRNRVGDVAITTDAIVGFPTETEEDHRATLDLFEKVGFDSAFTFVYSPRPGTQAARLPNDVPPDVKSRRISELIQLQKTIGLKKLQNEIGKTVEVLIEEVSKKSDQEWACRTDKFQTVIIPRKDLKIGDYVQVRLTGADGHTLFGMPLRD